MGRILSNGGSSGGCDGPAEPEPTVLDQKLRAWVDKEEVGTLRTAGVPTPPDTPSSCSCYKCRESLDSWYEDEPITITTSIEVLEITQDKALAGLSRLCASLEAQVEET